jgi:chemotaxis protein CheY-P-specific phosphatase CheC
MTPPQDGSGVDDYASLKKLLEEGVENSMESMAKLTNVNWAHVAVSLTAGSSQQFANIPEKRPENHSAVLLSAKGPFPLQFLLIFSPESSSALASNLAKNFQLDLGTAAETRKSVIEEVGNILVSSFLKRLANALKMTIFATSPRYLEGNRKELLNATLASIGGQSPQDENIVMARIGMRSSELSADCDMMILSNPECLRELVVRCR